MADNQTRFWKHFGISIAFMAPAWLIARFIVDVPGWKAATGFGLLFVAGYIRGLIDG